jgi:hypothetical protein
MEADVFTRSILLLVITLVPVSVVAQPRWDVTASTGLFAAHTPRTGGTGYQDTWLQTVQGGLTLGRYLTPHLKVEVEANAAHAASQFRERLVNVPGYPFPYPTGSEVTTATRSLAAALTWQFRDNEWFHPFVQAGVSGDFDRVTVRTWEQIFYGDVRGGAPPVRVAEERVEGPTTTTTVRGLVAGGAKVYFTQAAFVRTDARWTFDRERHNVALRLGVGVDF